MKTFKYPVVAYRVSLNEYPEHISCVIEIGNCTQHCPNCHRPDMKSHNYEQTAEEIEKIAEGYIEKGANAIVLMGGTTNGIPQENLKHLIRTLNLLAPVCLYSGSDEDHRTLWYETDLSALKTGSYQEKYGDITNPTTNQRFYLTKTTLIENDGYIQRYRKELVDITAQFYAKRNSNKRQT